MALTLLGTSSKAGGSGTGPRGPAGPAGPQGPAGVGGVAGVDGRDGQPRFTGYGPPPDVIVGFDPTRDVYLDRSTGLLYTVS